jgi:hypothetical protein
MAKKIELKSFHFPKKRPDTRSSDVLTKIGQEKHTKNINKVMGLVSTGIVEVTHTTGGYSWAISPYIDFAYDYIARPVFTWGIDGTAGIDWSAGDNQYSSSVPASLAAMTVETYQPAIFIPRIIHWNIVQGNFLGCHILVMQINPNCTESDKTCRLHYRFEGIGHRKG